jgi:hypothetical protein
MADPVLTETLDLTQPVALMLVAVLMLLDDEADPWAKSRTLMDALPVGSYVAITHPGLDFDPEAMAGIVAAAKQGNMTVVPRVKADVERFFDGSELIDPGVIPVMAWRAEGEMPADPNAATTRPGCPHTLSCRTEPAAACPPAEPCRDRSPRRP